MQSRKRKRASARTVKHARSKAKRPDIGGAIKRYVFKHPEASAEQVHKALAARGIKASLGTVQTYSADFRHSLRVLRELGVLSEPSPTR